MASAKRSITIAKHRTSVFVEDEFWDVLGEIAKAESVSIAKLVEHIDENRGEKNLSAAIRAFVLKTLRES